MEKKEFNMELSLFADTDLMVRPSAEPVLWPGGAFVLQALGSISPSDMDAAPQDRTLSFCPATGWHLPC